MADIDKKALKLLGGAAKRAADHAYSPYSGFRVGVAIMDRAGKVYTGCNVENASFGLTLCAERNAIAAAINAGCSPADLVSLVIYKAGPQPLPPCGACRQVMHEMMSEDSQVVSTCDSDGIKVWSRDEYLPDAFRFDQHQS